MLLPWILCGLLAAAVIILLIKIRLLQKGIDEICTEFERSLSTDTNVLISISSGDRHIRTLAKEISSLLRVLRKQQQQYRNGDRELKEAVTNISHDLRTPLTAICGYLDLLKDVEQSETVKRYVEQIRSRSETLKQLTEELFRYSVISSIPELTCEKVNLCRTLEESLISFYGAMQQANISPNIQIPAKAVWRNLDSSALTRIFNNIIGNAVKYSEGDFSVTLTEDGVITFTNTAKSLTSVEVGKLFDRFYTVDSARKSTGLGLSIAKLLTERMNGSIAANYKEEKLYITLTFIGNLELAE